MQPVHDDCSFHERFHRLKALDVKQQVSWMGMWKTEPLLLLESMLELSYEDSDLTTFWPKRLINDNSSPVIFCLPYN